MWRQCWSFRVPYRLRLFVSFCESSDWDFMKYTRCERLLLVKTLASNELKLHGMFIWVVLNTFHQNWTKIKNVEILVHLTFKAMFTVYQIAFAPPWKSYRTLGLLFTHKNGCSGAISVTKLRCAVPISQVESHISDRCSHYRVLKWWRHKNEISEIMGFVRIFWKNNVQEAYLPKMSISGQIVSEMLAG